MDITDFAEGVKTKEDFIRFLETFFHSLIKKEDDYENIDLKSFLFAMQRFLSDSNEKSLVPFDFTPSWKMFAMLLIATSVYE